MQNKADLALAIIRMPKGMRLLSYEECKRIRKFQDNNSNTSPGGNRLSNHITGITAFDNGEWDKNHTYEGTVYSNIYAVPLGFNVDEYLKTWR